MTTVTTQPLSPINDLVGKLQATGQPLLEQAKTIKANDRLSPQAKQQDIQRLVEQNDQAMDATLETAKDEATAALTSAQKTFRAARAELNDRIAGLTGDELSVEKDAKQALIEPKRTRIAVEGAQLLEAYGGDDSELARWVLGVIESATNDEQDAKLMVDWLHRAGLKLAKKQSTNPDKHLTTTQLVADAHNQIFNSSKVRAAEAEIQAAKEKLDGVRSVRMNYLHQICENRDYRIKELQR